jgi:hypothetical protein
MTARRRLYAAGALAALLCLGIGAAFAVPIFAKKADAATGPTTTNAAAGATDAAAASDPNCAANEAADVLGNLSPAQLSTLQYLVAAGGPATLADRLCNSPSLDDQPGGILGALLGFTQKDSPSLIQYGALGTLFGVGQTDPGDPTGGTGPIPCTLCVGGSVTIGHLGGTTTGGGSLLNGGTCAGILSGLVGRLLGSC